MRKYYLIFGLVVIFIASCSKGEVIDIEQNKLEITYYEEITGEQHTGKTYTIIEVMPFVKQVSETEELNLLQFTAKTNHDDSIVLFEVYANRTGNNALYNNVFDFRTAYGTPYNAAIMELEVLANNNTEFIANFSGTVKHYNQWVPELIFINIQSGSITYKY